MTDAPVSDSAGAAAPAPGARPVPARPSSTGPAAAAPVPPRSIDEIEADLDATRARLAQRLDDLQDYVDPRNVAQRQLAKVRGVFVDEYGGIKPDRVLVVVGVVAVILGIGAMRRRHRG